MSKEIWKQVPSYPEYEASSFGRIRLTPGGKPRMGSWDQDRHRYIFRCRRYKKTFKVSRMVCEAWYGKPPMGQPEVMHLDENPRNNRPENLAWGTRKQNANFPRLKNYQSRVCRIKMKGESPPPRLGLP